MGRRDDAQLYNTHKYDSVVKHNKFFGYLVTDMQVDDPVHQVETDEGDGKENPGVFVNV